MDTRISRFRYCDARFYPYLEKVLGQLPEEVKEGFLNDESLQIFADEELQDRCVQRQDFDPPAKKLLFLNTKVLVEPEHRVVCAVAHGIAHCMAEDVDPNTREQKVEELLVQWGFEGELEAVRYCLAVTESPGYAVGYEWAKKQDEGYLMLHFGLYFDEWNARGLNRMSKERFAELYDQADMASVLARTSRQRKKEGAAPIKKEISEAFTMDEGIIAGIMAAVREIKLQKGD